MTSMMMTSAFAHAACDPMGLAHLASDPMDLARLASDPMGLAHLASSTAWMGDDEDEGEDEQE
jgi:hypothetical protein